MAEVRREPRVAVWGHRREVTGVEGAHPCSTWSQPLAPRRAESLNPLSLSALPPAFLEGAVKRENPTQQRIAPPQARHGAQVTRRKQPPQPSAGQGQRAPGSPATALLEASGTGRGGAARQPGLSAEAALCSWGPGAAPSRPCDHEVPSRVGPPGGLCLSSPLTHGHKAGLSAQSHSGSYVQRCSDDNAWKRKSGEETLLCYLF